jgi:L-ascorbate metabolism protein UlaG (beta-lactamase superfamily)
LLPTNGLQVRRLNDTQVVMNATEAAELTAVLRPDLVVPDHYAFSSGWLGDRLITRKDRDPDLFAQAVERLSPGTTVRVVQPGVRVEL